MEMVDRRSAASIAIRVDNPAESERGIPQGVPRRRPRRACQPFELDAMFVPAPGDVAAGSAAIREVAASFLAMKGRLEFTSESMLQAKDMALKTYEWKCEGNDVHGNP